MLDLFFEKQCVICKKSGYFLCPECLDKMERVTIFRCPDCQRLNVNGGYCRLCVTRHELSGILESCKWQEPLRTVIHEFKYRRKKFLGDSLAGLLAERLDKIKYLGFDAVMPVPLHFLRRFSRGFNQAEVLARILAQKEKLPLFKNLKRCRWTKSQVRFSGAERRLRLSKAFKVVRPWEIKNKRILLVDDVATTGTTLEQCAKVLKEAGAKSVWGLVLARG